MKRNKIICYGRKSIMLLALLLLTGCLAGQGSYKKGNQALSEQQYDQAVFDYLAAVEKNPGNSEYRMKLNQARGKAALVHQRKADELFAAENYTEALREYGLAADLDKSLFSAYEGVKRAQNHLQAQKLIGEAEQLLKANQVAQAQDRVTQILTLVPDFQAALDLNNRIKQSQFALVDGVELDVISTQPIDLNFNKTKLPDVFDVLTQLSGINFILDEDIRDKRTTFYLEQATFAQSLELLLRMNKLDKKVLNSKTIILYPKTRDKKKQFEDQVIQTFYLSSLDAKKAVNMLRTMLQVRKIHVQEGLNAIVMRDQPDVIRLAQKLLEANDRGNSEVVFDLELIEVNHSDTRNLGVKLSTYSVGAGLSLPGSGEIVDSVLGTDTTNLIPFDNDLNPITDLDSFYTLPSATFRFVKTLVDAEILASPKIRVKNKEKAKVHVGTREPVITATTSDGVTTDSVQYVDVGVKLNVEPLIQLDNTIVTKIGLEVSNVSGRQTTDRGTAVITISSTNADTTLTLKDGEQTIIGGLIRDDKSTTKNKIPLLGDIPLLGEVFNGTDKTKSKREILLSVTPHIVKAVRVPRGETASIWSGGEDDLKYGRNFGTFAREYREAQNSPGEAEFVASEPSLDRSLDREPESPVSLVVSEPAADQTDSVPGAPPAMVFIAGPNQLKQGDEMTFKVNVMAVEDLFSAPMTIHYNPELLQFTGATEGSFLSQNGGTTLLSYPPADAVDGLLDIELTKEGQGSGASNGGDLLHLRFKALQPGQAEIVPKQLDFRNAQGVEIVPSSIGLKLEIVP